jgi:hypothetical protein
MWTISPNKTVRAEGPKHEMPIFENGFSGQASFISIQNSANNNGLSGNSRFNFLGNLVKTYAISLRLFNNVYNIVNHTEFNGRMTDDVMNNQPAPWC